MNVDRKVLDTRHLKSKSLCRWDGPAAIAGQQAQSPPGRHSCDEEQASCARMAATKYLQRDEPSLARFRLQYAKAAEPVDAELRPARREFLVLTHTEVMIAVGKNVQFNRDTGALQGDVHERAVFRI